MLFTCVSFAFVCCIAFNKCTINIIIDFLEEIWMEKINSGKLLKVKNFESIFNIDYCNRKDFLSYWTGEIKETDDFVIVRLTDYDPYAE